MLITDDLTSSKSEGSKRCNTCGAHFSAESKICTACGSPTFWISRIAHVHSSTISAFSVLIALIALFGLVVNLINVRKQIDLQRTGFIEQFRPRLKMVCKSFKLKADTLRIYLDVTNTGLGDAMEVREDVYITYRNQGFMPLGTFVHEQLVRDETQTDEAIIGCQKADFQLSIATTYGWFSDKQRMNMQKNYDFTFDAMAQNYQIRSVAALKER